MWSEDSQHASQPSKKVIDAFVSVHRMPEYLPPWSGPYTNFPTQVCPVQARPFEPIILLGNLTSSHRT